MTLPINQLLQQQEKMKIASEADNFPTKTLLKFDDHQNQKSAYVEFHEIEFEVKDFSAGNKFQRQQYNITPDIKKYFCKRKFLFSLFDQGIQIDRQSWYSVVAEPISMFLGQQLKYYGVQTVMEPFCGVGGIAVHLCDQFKTYYVNDIDSQKLKMLADNLSVYGKSRNNIKMKNKDIFLIQPFKVDAVIACPPWGGLQLEEYSYRDLDEIMNPKLSQIILHCLKFSENLVLQMPKNTNIDNLLKVINSCFVKPLVRIEKVMVNGKNSQLFVYVGSQKFLHMNPNIYDQIIKDSGKKQLKEFSEKKKQKKQIKSTIQKGDLSIFGQIYALGTKKKHIFFTTNEQGEQS